MELLRGHPQWQINTLNVRYVVPFRNSPNQQASFDTKQSDAETGLSASWSPE